MNLAWFTTKDAAEWGNEKQPHEYPHAKKWSWQPSFSFLLRSKPSVLFSLLRCTSLWHILSTNLTFGVNLNEPCSRLLLPSNLTAVCNSIETMLIYACIFTTSCWWEWSQIHSSSFFSTWDPVPVKSVRGHQLSDSRLASFVQCSEVFVGAVDAAAGHYVLEIENKWGIEISYWIPLSYNLNLSMISLINSCIFLKVVCSGETFIRGKEYDLYSSMYCGEGVFRLNDKFSTGLHSFHIFLCVFWLEK